MAGDWIKMRVWLSRDPRVIRMADYLSENRAFMNWLTDPVRQSCNESAYEHVTRNVIVSLCVTGLLVTWGTAREQGDRNADDLVLTHCDKYTFDAITDIESFGEAMEHVGWLIDDDNGSVILPKFFKDMESPDEKHKRQNAERQANFRAKQQSINNAKDNVTNNVTVTTEKRREENNKNTSAFAEFWAAYPKKKSKGDAEKAFNKLDQKLLPQILAAIILAKQTEDWQKEKGKYIPYPASWLNAKGWEDEQEVKTIEVRKLVL